MSKRGCLENSPAFPKYIVPSGTGCSGRRGPSVFNNPQGIFSPGIFWPLLSMGASTTRHPMATVFLAVLWRKASFAQSRSPSLLPGRGTCGFTPR